MATRHSPRPSRAHPRRRPDLADELWTAAHLAAYLHCGRSTAYATTTEPGFPAALTVGRSGRRLWPAAEVRAWAGRLPRISAAPPVPRTPRHSGGGR